MSYWHKRGDIVAVCYDGKFSRRVKGTVLETKQGKIKVQFPQWDDDSVTLTHWFKMRQRRKRYGGVPFYHAGYVPCKDSIMDMMYGTGGDWYSVYEWRD